MQMYFDIIVSYLYLEFNWLYYALCNGFSI